MKKTFMYIIRAVAWLMLPIVMVCVVFRTAWFVASVKADRYFRRIGLSK